MHQITARKSEFCAAASLNREMAQKDQLQEIMKICISACTRSADMLSIVSEIIRGLWEYANPVYVCLEEEWGKANNHVP